MLMRAAQLFQPANPWLAAQQADLLALAMREQGVVGRHCWREGRGLECQGRRRVGVGQGEQEQQVSTEGKSQTQGGMKMHP